MRLERGLCALGLVVLTAIAGCKTDLDPFACAGDTACDLSTGGRCLQAANGPTCAYPGPCPSGLVWRDDGALDGECVDPSVVAGTPDAGAVEPDGPSGPADAMVDLPGDDMVVVPAGPFKMGCNPAAELEGNYCATAAAADQLPYHEVTLREFNIDRLETSKAEYKRCVDAGGCGSISGLSVRPNEPVVVRVSEARTYCEWRGARLPTEAEWEKAARGTDERRFPWGNEDVTCALANVGTCMLGYVDVETYSNSASPYGAISMVGNVWEWVSDGYKADYYSMSPPSNPEGPGHGGNILRVKRGGDLNVSGPRASLRGFGDVTDPEAKAGIRCAF
jgi:sulfatase modifying factor 1